MLSHTNIIFQVDDGTLSGYEGRIKVRKIKDTDEILIGRAVRHSKIDSVRVNRQNETVQLLKKKDGEQNVIEEHILTGIEE